MVLHRVCVQARLDCPVGRSAFRHFLLERGR